MPDDTSSIGEKLKKLRMEKDLSLEDVAIQAGMTVSLLQEIEQNDISPPLGNIVSLAKVLEVTVGEFFGDSGDSPFCIVRSDDRRGVSRFSAEYSKSCGYSYQGLGQQKRNRQMEPFLITLNPATDKKVEPNRHIGEEFIFVLDGQVEVNLLDHRDILSSGDSIYYDSNVPHIISCYGDKPATILAVIYAKEEMIIL